jgi:hypothetical protein
LGASNLKLKTRIRELKTSSALTLLVLLRRADNQHFTVPANNLAIVTTLLDGCAHFHGRVSFGSLAVTGFGYL